MVLTPGVLQSLFLLRNQIHFLPFDDKRQWTVGNCLKI